MTQEQEEFYQLYPGLRAHNEIVQTAFDQLKQSGFQAKTVAEANRVLALRAYALLNQSSGAKMPYRQVLEQYNQARSQEPDLKNLSLPEFANLMNKVSGSTAFDEGLNANWLERASANIGVTFHQGWGIVMVLAGLILLVIVFRATSRSPKSPAQQDQSPMVREKDSALKVCPFCKERIRQEAVKCRYCGEWLEPGAQPKSDLASKLTTASSVPSTPTQQQPAADPAVANEPLRMNMRKKTALVGVGGWLGFFCISLTILGPFWWLVRISNAWPNAQPAFDRLPAAKTAAYVELAGSAAIVLYGFIIGCLIWNGVPYGKLIAKQYLLIRLVLLAGVETIAFGLVPMSVVNAGLVAAIPDYIATAVFSLVWWLYFQRSVRVRNTYG